MPTVGVGRNDAGATGLFADNRMSTRITRTAGRTLTRSTVRWEGVARGFAALFAGLRFGAAFFFGAALVLGAARFRFGAVFLFIATVFFAVFFFVAVFFAIVISSVAEDYRRATLLP
jgi:hypothetical protein